MHIRFLTTMILAASAVFAQAPPPDTLKQRDTPLPVDTFQVDAGTHILLSMVNTVSTKQAQVGDRLYLETAFPVSSNGKMIVPKGSYVIGTVTGVTQPKRGRSRGALQIRFDSLTLPNGATRSFRSDLGALDGAGNLSLNREQSKATAPSHKPGDARTVAETAGVGTVVGSTIGAASAHPIIGAGAGAGIGAAAGLFGMMMTRGPDAVLSRGQTVEMVLDRPISFNAAELGSNGSH